MLLGEKKERKKVIRVTTKKKNGRTMEKKRKGHEQGNPT